MPHKKLSLTNVLVGINVAVYVAMVVKGISPIEPTTDALRSWGANWGPLSLGTQPWRILTSNYLHAGILHIGLNMWCLWNLGILSEQIFDPWTYFLTYTACGLSGSIVSLWWHPLVVGVGASGAIFGLAGALIAVLYLGHLPIPREAMQGTLRSLLTFAGYNLLFGAVGRGIDNSAHIGGIVCGLIIGALLATHRSSEIPARLRWRTTVFVAAAAVLFVMFGMVRKSRAYAASVQTGMQAIQDNRWDDAERALEVASKQKPNDHDILFLLATAYSQKKEFEKAEPMWQQVLQLKPNDGAAQANLGLVQLQRGEYDQATVSLAKAVPMNPEDADLMESLGEAYQGNNQPEKAKDAFQRSVDIRKASKPK